MPNLTELAFCVGEATIQSSLQRILGTHPPPPKLEALHLDATDVIHSVPPTLISSCRLELPGIKRLTLTQLRLSDILSHLCFAVLILIDSSFNP